MQEGKRASVSPYILKEQDNKINIGIYGTTAYVGGNSNNTSHVGTLYSNLNNTTSNTNVTNGAAIFIYYGIITKCIIFPLPLGKN